MKTIAANAPPARKSAPTKQPIHISDLLSVWSDTKDPLKDTSEFNSATGLSVVKLLSNDGEIGVDKLMLFVNLAIVVVI